MLIKTAATRTTLSSQLDVVEGLERLGNIAEAMQLTLEIKESCLSDFPDDVKLLSDVDWYLSWLLLQSGRLDEAENIARKSFEIASTRIEDAVYAEDSRSELAATLIAKGQLEEAVQLYGNFPTYPALDREYNMQGEFDPDESDVQLIVFWEEWCPYCDRLMGKVETLYRRYNNYGIDMVGVTNLWEPSTREDGESFLRNHDVSFPIIKEGGEAFAHFNATRVPAIRLVYKGNLIWEKRVPSVAPISRLMLEGIVKAL